MTTTSGPTPAAHPSSATPAGPSTDATPGLHGGRVQVAVDTGGTFTDVIARCGSRLVTCKVPSTPHDPALAVADGLAQALLQLQETACDTLVHGTTVATNALLQNTLDDTWLVVDEGHADLLAIGRQYREELYAMHPQQRPPRIPRDRVVEVPGRRDHQGALLVPRNWEAFARTVAALPQRPRAWAVCLLHAYVNDEDERQVGQILRGVAPDDPIVLSSEVLPVFREVERASTTAANAALVRGMAGYLSRLRPLAARVDVQGSSGGRLGLATASLLPAATALSGPAGGVVAAQSVATRLGLPGVVSFDMGGTSTDVALVGQTLPLRHEARVGDWDVHLPALDIHTVGAGGGSLAHLDATGLQVGPRSAGADPGPACYGRGQLPTVTDANVVLGRLPAQTRLGGTLALQPARAHAAFAPLAAAMGVSVEAAAQGVLDVAGEAMARAIRRVTVERGVDPQGLALCAFGGAGGLHACDVATRLGMPRVIVPMHAGVLSAAGMLQGQAVAERARTVLGLDPARVAAVRDALVAEAAFALGETATAVQVTLAARYAGQGFELAVAFDGAVAEAAAAFEQAHLQQFGYRLAVPVTPVTVRVRALGAMPAPLPTTEHPLAIVQGPSAIVEDGHTLWVATGWSARRAPTGDWVLERDITADAPAEAAASQWIALQVWRHRLAGIAEEMGERLTRAAFSPNIRERRDHSCALFDQDGQMVAQAAHIPVHLGAAPACVQAVIAAGPPAPGETWIVNDPWAGGTHLPDITLVTRVPLDAQDPHGPCWYVATRAHHADVGGITPGSLPPSRTLADEGWCTPPVLLTAAVEASLLAASRTPEERRGDLAAQRGANQLGAQRVQALAATFGAPALTAMASALLSASATRAAEALAALPAGEVTVEDWLDDADGGGQPVAIRLTLQVTHGAPGARLTADFCASDDQVMGPMNAVPAIVASACFYVLMLCCGPGTAANSGLFRQLAVHTRRGSVLDPHPGAAVAAGNVETSQRLVDVLLQALEALSPGTIPASSCGSMNNVLIGAAGHEGQSPWVYYETNAGGAGGGPQGPGASALQTHMTNTWNTPIEALEHAYPMWIARYAIRRGSGGAGHHAGGDGIERIWRLRQPAQVTVLAERRRRGAPGAGGGAAGEVGAQWWVDEHGVCHALPGKTTVHLPAGGALVLHTPGGGGWGVAD